MTDTLSRVAQVLEARKGATPDSSYVASLYHKGLNKILEKVGEESVETILAAKDAAAALAALQRHLTERAPFGARVTFPHAHAAAGSSSSTFGRSCDFRSGRRVHAVRVEHGLGAVAAGLHLSDPRGR